MNKTRQRIFAVAAAVAVIFGLAACATTGVTKADLDDAKDLAKRFVDSINHKDLEGTMACIWNSPQMLWVNFGTVVWGYDGFRNGMVQMFEQNETVKIAVTDISYVPVGDMIMAVGTATIDLQPISRGPAVHLVERWSDLEKKIDGRWVYVLDHTTPVAK
jgi:ketosteroid isomerase-like protein